jgi:hypothetical protein
MLGTGGVGVGIGAGVSAKLFVINKKKRLVLMKRGSCDIL